MVCRANVGRGRGREWCLVRQAKAQSDLFHDFECQRKVAEKDVDAEESDERKVAELAVQWPRAVLADDVAVLDVNESVDEDGEVRTRSLGRSWLGHGP